MNYQWCRHRRTHYGPNKRPLWRQLKYEFWPWMSTGALNVNLNVEHRKISNKLQTEHLPAGEDAGGGEEDDGDRVGGTQQPVAVEGRRDLLSQLLAQRHSWWRGQLPAIGKHCATDDGAPRGIQGPGGVGEVSLIIHLKTQMLVCVSHCRSDPHVYQLLLCFSAHFHITGSLSDSSDVDGWCNRNRWLMAAVFKISMGNNNKTSEPATNMLKMARYPDPV